MDWRDKETRFGLLLFIAIIAVAFYFASIFLGFFFAASDNVKTSIIAGGIAIFSVIFAYWKERTRTIREAHRDKKIEVYTIFFNIVFEILKKQKDDDNLDLENDPDFKAKWFEMNRGLIFYGSHEVISAVSKMKTAGSHSNEGPESIQNIGDIFLAMRKDIGLSNKGLNNINIHQVYVNDDIKKLFPSGA